MTLQKHGKKQKECNLTRALLRRNEALLREWEQDIAGEPLRSKTDRVRPVGVPARACMMHIRHQGLTGERVGSRCVYMGEKLKEKNSLTRNLEVKKILVIYYSPDGIKLMIESNFSSHKTFWIITLKILHTQWITVIIIKTFFDHLFHNLWFTSHIFKKIIQQGYSTNCSGGHSYTKIYKYQGGGVFYLGLLGRGVSLWTASSYKSLPYKIISKWE